MLHKSLIDAIGHTPLVELTRLSPSEDVRLFADDLFNIACQRSEEVDQIIVRNARWRMDRMAAVDRNLLRTGVAELLGFPETPRPVVINEALEIARRFSTPESVTFINGVLDSVARELPEVKKQRSARASKQKRAEGDA